MLPGLPAPGRSRLNPAPAAVVQGGARVWKFTSIRGGIKSADLFSGALSDLRFFPGPLPKPIPKRLHRLLPRPAGKVLPG